VDVRDCHLSTEGLCWYLKSKIDEIMEEGGDVRGVKKRWSGVRVRGVRVLYVWSPTNDWRRVTGAETFDV